MEFYETFLESCQDYHDTTVTTYTHLKFPVVEEFAPEKISLELLYSSIWKSWWLKHSIEYSRFIYLFMSYQCQLLLSY